MTDTGTIFNIQRFATHDGSGIRTTVFFKGCPLRCLWCANPESQSPIPQLMIRQVKCGGCGVCERVCPTNAIIRAEDGRVTFPDPELCSQCFACVDVCPSGALNIIGEIITAERVMDTVRRDAPFYKNTGGGVTFSGGEAMMQPDFLYALMARARAEGFHTALDTTGFGNAPEFDRILPLTDLVLFDIKLLDNQAHKAMTGVGTNLIRRNLEKITASVRTWFRVPVISGVNADPDSMDAVASLARELGVEKVSLLPFHDGGISKMAQIGMGTRGFKGEAPDRFQLEKLKGIVAGKGVKVAIGA